MMREMTKKRRGGGRGRRKRREGLLCYKFVYLSGNRGHNPKYSLAQKE